MELLDGFNSGEPCTNFSRHGNSFHVVFFSLLFPPTNSTQKIDDDELQVFQQRPPPVKAFICETLSNDFNLHFKPGKP